MRILTFVLIIAIILAYSLFVSVLPTITSIREVNGQKDRNNAARNDFMREQRVNNNSHSNIDEAHNNTLKPVFSPLLPKGKNIWMPLTQTERNEYHEKEKLVCGKPFMHCCLGQG